MKTELKPCPFCGGEAIRKTVNIPHKSEPWHYIVCGNPNCLVEPGTAAYPKQGGATKAWNRVVEGDVATVCGYFASDELVDYFMDSLTDMFGLREEVNSDE